MTRLVLVSGKGGVGKTTVSAATAVAAARRGSRVLVASLDRAHNLAAVLGVEPASSPTPVPAVPGLSILEIDPQVELRAQWHELSSWLGHLLGWLGVPAAVADEVAVLPGLEELLVLGRLVELVESGDWDLVVADLAPTASSLRYLSFPDLASGLVGRMIRLERSFLAVARPALTRVTDAPVPPDAVYDALDRIAARLGRLRDRLVDPNRTVVRLVAVPEAVVIDETREAHAAMALFGLAVDAVVLNRVLPPEATTGYLAAWAGVQARERARVAESFPGLSKLEIPFQPCEPLGVAALAKLGEALFGDRDPGAPFASEPPLRFHTVDGRTVLDLAVHDARPGDVDLLQRDGDLVLTVGRWRRVLRLPESLHRAPIERAAVAGGRMRVTFGKERPR
jgi:arsenite-transporting ATPase